MYDVVIIGAGPAGYKCALSCYKELKILVIDNNNLLGGTCLRVGCIPSKAMLHASHKYQELKSQKLTDLGIQIENARFDLKQCNLTRDNGVKTLASGIDYLFKKNGIDKIHGFAKIISILQNDITLSVETLEDNKTEVIKTKKVVIATGSTHTNLPHIKIDKKYIISSTECLGLEKIPKSMIILGAGAIGLEMASIWSRLSTNVTVIDMSDRIAPTLDKDISIALQKLLEKQGINFKLQSKCLDAKIKGDTVNVEIENETTKSTLQAEKLLVAIGRSPNTSGLHKEIELDSRGFIKVNSEYETTANGIFAIGDVIGRQMLAHKAEQEGIIVSEILSGKKNRSIRYSEIPAVIYTHPPVSSIGYTESYLKEQNIPYKIAKSNFTANGRARVSLCTDGFVKILSHKQYDTILGVHIIGESADIIINEASVAMAYGASSEDLYRICHSHPDLSEALRDAAHAVFIKK